MHQDEGSDDLPAHLKSSILGNSLNIPIADGHPRLGTWQGIYLCEHRDCGGNTINKKKPTTVPLVLLA